MNETTHQGNNLPKKYGILYIIYDLSWKYLFEILVNLKKMSYGMILDIFDFNLWKEKHVQNDIKMGESAFVQPMDIQKTVKIGAIIYIAVAMVTIPSGICSSSYQAQDIPFTLLAAHPVSEYLQESNALSITPKPVSITEELGEEEAPRVEDANTPPFHGHILRASQTYEVDMALIRAIIMAESSNNPRAVSHRGAKGLMQLMPITAKSLGVEDAFDPALNIDGGVRYFKRLLDRFNGDITLALAAYNAGSRYVRKYGGVPPFKATRLYIKKVLKYHREYQAETEADQNKLTMG